MARKTPRPNVVALRLTDAELAAVENAAAFHGQTVSQWMREAMKPHLYNLITVNGVKVA